MSLMLILERDRVCDIICTASSCLLTRNPKIYEENPSKYIGLSPYGNRLLNMLHLQNPRLWQHCIILYMYTKVTKVTYNLSGSVAPPPMIGVSSRLNVGPF